MFNNSTVLKWLLENNNPAIKYRTMMEICDNKAEDCSEVYDLIWQQYTIVSMLKKQDENGLFSCKDYGVHTSLRYLTAFAEHGLQVDKRLERFVDFTIDFLFSCDRQGDLAGCATPLTLRALVMLGYHNDNNVKDLISRFVSMQLFDGGFMCKMKLGIKPNRKSCYKATLSGLLLYAECKRKNILPSNVDKLIDYFLRRDVFYSSDKSVSFKEGKAGWRFVDNFFPVEPMRMGLPQIVGALSILGVSGSPAVAEAWELLQKKVNEDGLLFLEGTLTKQPCSFGKVSQPNKWITFYALLAEKYHNANL